MSFIMPFTFEAGSLTEPGVFGFQSGLEPISLPTPPWGYTHVQEQAWVFMRVLRCLLLTTKPFLQPWILYFLKKGVFILWDLVGCCESGLSWKALFLSFFKSASFPSTSSLLLWHSQGVLPGWCLAVWTSSHQNHLPNERLCCLRY